MKTSKSFEFMGYLHFEVMLKDTAYQFNVYDKSDIGYEDQKNKGYFGPLIGTFEVPVSAAGDLKGINVVDVKNRMYLVNHDDESVDTLKIPLRYNKEANKYVFADGIKRVSHMVKNSTPAPVQAQTGRGK